MKRPRNIGPAAMGGGVLVGIAAAFASGYRVTECIRFQSKPGECQEVVDANALAITAGVASLIAAIGGYGTYNRKLERPNPPRPLTHAEKVQEARRLHEEGLSYRDIAERLGCAHSTARRWVVR